MGGSREGVGFYSNLIRGRKGMYLMYQPPPGTPKPTPGRPPWKGLFGAALGMCLPAIGGENPCRIGS